MLNIKNWSLLPAYVSPAFVVWMAQNQFACFIVIFPGSNLLLEKNLLKDEIRIVIYHSDYLRRLFSRRIDSSKGYESLARGFTLASWLFYSSYLLELHVFMPFLFILTLRFGRSPSSDTSQSTTGDGKLNEETLYQELPYILNYLPI